MNSPTFFVRPERTTAWKEFYARLDEKRTAPLWEVLGRLVRVEPQSACVPVLWRYDEVRPLLMEAGRLITAREAERRVLILQNPGLHGAPQVTQSLYAGLQLLLPGEVAPSHRHTAAALRFIIEGDGGYTAVNGERTMMHPGDFILTPSWTYHDHGNPGEAAVVWLDGLDIPIVNMFDTSFAEHHPADTQPVTRKEGDALARYGATMLPLDDTRADSPVPMLSYPYARSRETLHQLHRHGPVDPHHAVKLRYANPVTGGHVLPTIGAFLQLLPAGFTGSPSRSTDATTYCVAEGRGSTQIGDRRFTWGPHDIFVVPSWAPVSHVQEGREDAVLFSFSDRPAQTALGLWREERL